MSSCRTRASNSSKHPGLLVKPATRRTSADVKAAAKVKEAANAAKKQAKEAHIKRVAEFESNAQDHEDLIDATPRPNFTRRDSNPDSDASLGTSEDDGPNPDKHTYAPPDKSDDSDESEDLDNVAEVAPIPKRKKVTPAAALATITENSEDSPEPLASKTPWMP